MDKKYGFFRLQMNYAILCVVTIVCLLTSIFIQAADYTENVEKTIPVSSNDTSDYISDELRQKLAESQEKHTYVAEMDRLMDLITNHLYRSSEVFLRELISNSADALEKVRFLSLSQEKFTGDKLEIRIEFDKELKTISITDTGIGMTKDDLINNLGTVAKSGSTNFMEALGQSGGDVSLIGRFGVGFYAAFLVADRVTVITKHDDADQYIWESSADGSYIVAADPRGNTMNRGTRVILHVKEDATEYLDEAKLKELAGSYGKFMSFPIYVKVQKTKTEEVPEEDQKKEKEGDVEVKEGEEKEIKKKKVEVKYFEWELVNPDKAIWLRPPEEVEEKQYNEFYKSISKDWSDPLTYVHFTAEGEIEFKAVMFIPGRAPYDMFDNYFNKQTKIKLYVRRSFIGDKFEDLLPRYLHFISGVVSSDDLPLNVSREQLQQHKLIKIISKKLVKKILELIRSLAKDSDTQKSKLLEDIKAETDEEKKKNLMKASEEPTKFDKFWKEFSKAMKLGCYEDDANRSKIAKVMKFYTSKSGKNQITLDKYVEEMRPNQKVIYYISGESTQQLDKSPHMQIFLKKNIDVLYLLEAMDEPCIQRMTDYDGKKFVSIAKGDAEIDETEEEKKRYSKLKKMYEPLTKWLQENLSKKIQKVELSHRLVSDPCTVVASQYGYSAHMEKLLKSQTFTDTSQLKSMANQKIFEINPNHPVIVDLLNKVKTNKDDPSAKETANKLYQAAMLASGFDIDNPTEIANMVYDYVSKNLGVEPGEAFEEVDVSGIDDDVAADVADDKINVDEKEIVDDDSEKDKEEESEKDKEEESEKDKEEESEKDKEEWEKDQEKESEKDKEEWDKEKVEEEATQENKAKDEL